MNHLKRPSYFYQYRILDFVASIKYDFIATIDSSHTLLIKSLSTNKILCQRSFDEILDCIELSDSMIHLRSCSYEYFFCCKKKVFLKKNPHHEYEVIISRLKVTIKLKNKICWQKEIRVDEISRGEVCGDFIFIFVKNKNFNEILIWNFKANIQFNWQNSDMLLFRKNFSFNKINASIEKINVCYEPSIAEIQNKEFQQSEYMENSIYVVNGNELVTQKTINGVRHILIYLSTANVPFHEIIDANIKGNDLKADRLINEKVFLKSGKLYYWDLHSRLIENNFRRRKKKIIYHEKSNSFYDRVMFDAKNLILCYWSHEHTLIIDINKKIADDYCCDKNDYINEVRAIDPSNYLVVLNDDKILKRKINSNNMEIISERRENISNIFLDKKILYAFSDRGVVYHWDISTFTRTKKEIISRFAYKVIAADLKRNQLNCVSYHQNRCKEFFYDNNLKKWQKTKMPAGCKPVYIKSKAYQYYLDFEYSKIYIFTANELYFTLNLVDVPLFSCYMPFYHKETNGCILFGGKTVYRFNLKTKTLTPVYEEIDNDISIKYIEKIGNDLYVFKENFSLEKYHYPTGKLIWKIKTDFEAVNSVIYIKKKNAIFVSDYYSNHILEIELEKGHIFIHRITDIANIMKMLKVPQRNEIILLEETGIIKIVNMESFSVVNTLFTLPPSSKNKLKEGWVTMDAKQNGMGSMGWEKYFE